MRVLLFITVFLHFLCIKGFSQTSAQLFLHTDKAIYVNNEYIWFSAYLLNTTTTDTAAHTLYTVLCERNKQEPVLAERFLVRYGFGQGAILLPDSLPAGEYNLLAYLNGDSIQHRSPLFHQPISVRSFKVPAPVLKVKGDTIRLAKEMTSPVQVLQQPDSARYHKRSLTRWKVKLLDEDGKPVRAVFSVSCVYNKRILRGMPDIVGYSSLQKFVVQDSLMLTAVSGKVQYNKKAVKKPAALAALVAFGPDGMAPLTTDEKGSFQLSEKELLAEAGTKLMISVAEKNQDLYSIELNDNTEALNRELAKIVFSTVAVPIIVFSEEEQKLHKSVMETVVIKTRTKDDYYPDMPFGKDLCDGWVCSCDHWRCNGCKPLVKPTVGKRYTVKETGQSFIFFDCDPKEQQAFVKQIKPTNLPKAFFVKDYSKEDLPGPELNTTLYWNDFITTDENGEASFSFYTNDLPGDFICVLQGVSEKGLLSGKTTIRVLKD